MNKSGLSYASTSSRLASTTFLAFKGGSKSSPASLGRPVALEKGRMKIVYMRYIEIRGPIRGFDQVWQVIARVSANIRPVHRCEICPVSNDLELPGRLEAKVGTATLATL